MGGGVKLWTGGSKVFIPHTVFSHFRVSLPLLSRAETLIVSMNLTFCCLCLPFLLPRQQIFQCSHGCKVFLQFNSIEKTQR